jgi:glucosaminylphosphatidylinositol acyltransferase
MDAKAYKLLHESFMQNNTGTTPWETVLIIIPTAVLTILSNCLNIILINVTRNSFLIEFVVLVMPLVLNATVLSENITTNLVVFCIITFFSIFVLYTYSPKRHLVNHSYLNKHLDISLVITNFRGTVNLITAICILAVDFRSFPRRFAKTETFGWGLMDTGVGLFVLTNGLVDPFARNQVLSLRKTIKGCFPMLFLGFLRWFSIWWLQYQQHITEYGVHWNFFVTLAFTRLISTILLKIIKRPLLLAVICIFVHEFLLQKGMTDFVIGTSPRDNMFLANRYKYKQY